MCGPSWDTSGPGKVGGSPLGLHPGPSPDAISFLELERHARVLSTNAARLERAEKGGRQWCGQGLRPVLEVEMSQTLEPVD